ncbi:DUF1285 domain-containing protein [Novosphingobium bradum]|uniref:DUF1285 domain-containing protein n=1 Tax=Novosphingobium bradum TaxID=1737444 RepID=A0ABV7IUM8_9SPHN
MPYEPPPELAALSLADIAAEVAARRLPPLDQWAPVETGESHMEIRADGRWFHEGGEITRPAMIRAFAGLLVRDGDGRHWLMTPHQRLAIAVADAAFIATDVVRRADGSGAGGLAFRLNTDDIVLAGPDHPLRAAGDAAVPALYLAVRHGCEARLNRSTYAQLADLALDEGDDWCVTSQGRRFSLVPA